MNRKGNFSFGNERGNTIIGLINENKNKLIEKMRSCKLFWFSVIIFLYVN